MTVVDNPVFQSAPGRAARISITRSACYAPGRRRFLAVVDKRKLTARSLTSEDYIRSRAEDERQAHLLSIELSSRSERADGEYLPNYRWNGVLEAVQRLIKKPDRHFQRPVDNWYEDQDQDLERRQGGISRQDFGGPCFEFGLIAQLRSRRRRGFGFTNLAGKAASYSGPVHLSMRSGFADASCITHRRSYYGAEQLFIEIIVDYERMKFIYEQLLVRRNALLGLGFEFDHLEKVDSSAEDQIFYIPRNRSISIKSVSAQINDGDWDRGIVDARAT